MSNYRNPANYSYQTPTNTNTANPYAAYATNTQTYVPQVATNATMLSNVLNANALAAYGYTNQPSVAMSAYPTTATTAMYTPTATQQAYTRYAAQVAASQQQQRSASTGVPTNSLWIGDLDQWMDENYLYTLFSYAQDLLNVKVIRDKQTGAHQGYGFLYFSNAVAAQRVLESYNGQLIPGTAKYFKLNYASHGGSNSSQPNKPPPPPAKPKDGGGLFVGDLAPDVNDYFLLSTFQYYYPSVYSARVVVDSQTGTSKCYGFVYFGDENERNRALTEMQGYQLSYRPIKVNLAAKKGGPPTTTQPMQPQAPPPQQQQHHVGNSGGGSHHRGGREGGSGGHHHRSEHHPSPSNNMAGANDPNNMTVFIGGIDASITYDLLKSYFSPYGEIVSVKIPLGKGCAFVEYTNHESAAKAIKELGTTPLLGTCQARLAWGRPSKPQSHSSSSGSGERESYSHTSPPESTSDESDPYAVGLKAEEGYQETEGHKRKYEATLNEEPPIIKHEFTTRQESEEATTKQENEEVTTKQESEDVTVPGLEFFSTGEIDGVTNPDQQEQTEVPQVQTEVPEEAEGGDDDDDESQRTKKRKV